MRLAHLSDTHCSERLRLDDWIEVHKEIARNIEKEGVDLIVHSGDWFHAKSTPRERIALWDFLRQCLSFAPVFGVKGNHDAPGDLELITSHLTGTEFPIKIVEAWNRTPWYTGRFGLIGMPWIDKSHFMAASSEAYDIGKSNRAVIEKMQELLDQMRKQATEIRDRDFIPIFVGHVMIAGSMLSNGQCLIGQTVELGWHEVDYIGAEYAALGHIHKAQEWGAPPKPGTDRPGRVGSVAYSGSTMRHNYGEPEQKSWRLAEFNDAGTFLRAHTYEIQTRPIIHIDIDWSGESPYMHIIPQDAEYNGALVRVRYKVEASGLDIAARGARQVMKDLIEAGVHEVKVEAVIVQHDRVRAAEVKSASTLNEKLAAYWTARGIDLNDETTARLFRKSEKLQEKLG